MTFHILIFHCRAPTYPTLGARDFSSAVSGFCQVFIVTFAARGFGLRPKMCRPSANTENSHRTREKPLVPRVGMWRVVVVLNMRCRKVEGNYFSRNFMCILRTTTTRHMESFIDFYFHFLANFQT